MNRFVFIIPFRNVNNYIRQCAESLISQSYENWIAIFCDDASTDGTINNIPEDDRFIILRNEERISALPNIHNALIKSEINDDDIIAILDGDDYLSRVDAIEIVNSLYNDDTLLTYGQYAYQDGRVGHCRAYTREIFNELRKHGHWASQLRTFKFLVYKEMMNQDPNLNCYKDRNGDFYKSTYDVAIMTPLLEISGFDRIKFNPIPIYTYRIHSQNDHNVDPLLQRNIASEIFNKNGFNKIIK